MSGKRLPLVVAGESWEDGEFRVVRNPWNGEPLAEVAWGNSQALERAIAGAAAAAPRMRAVSRGERSAWCQKIAAGLESRLEEFATTLSAESGKPIRFARDEVRRAVSTFTFAAQEALRFGGEFVPLDVGAASAGYHGVSQRFGAGPVAAITPFNFPLNLVAHKVAPALAVGNPVILKPAPATPLTALLLTDLVLQSGVPGDGFSCLNLNICDIEKLTDDPRVPIISFTGSGTVGWAIKARVPHKKVILELGGNATALVHSDANLDHAIPRIAAGGYAYAGQVCISVQHILVHRPIHEEFTQRYTAEVAKLGVGDPALESTVVGPMIRPQEVDRLQAWTDEAVAAGAQVMLGGKSRPPCFEPTILAGVPHCVRLSREEAFGPITTVDSYDQFSDAIARVNRSAYGLQVGVFTRDLERVMSSWESLEVGAVIVNDFPTFRVDNMPYGGIKKSGFGREGVAYSMEEMSEPRLLVINRNPLRESGT